MFVGLMGTGGATGVAQAAPTHAQWLLTARYKNLATGRCLDVRDESYDDAAVVQQFKCKDGQNQVFGVGPNDVGGQALYTRRSYKCVEPRDGTYDGAGVQQWACNNSFEQQWRTDTVGRNIVVLRHYMSGKCLEDMGQPSGNRREVGLMPCTGASNQAWRYDLV
ncbi:RICIN domain-containing protein [Streptomyces sp. NPDC086787]|uniref:RICIN domain-containing protein n=1 Tax=Streptomyces sp. NPDC086787 TaxID=3365759 RepID=UPI003827BED4